MVDLHAPAAHFGAGLVFAQFVQSRKGMTGGDLRVVYDPDHGGMTVGIIVYDRIVIPTGTGIWQSVVLQIANCSFAVLQSAVTAVYCNIAVAADVVLQNCSLQAQGLHLCSARARVAVTVY